MSLGTQIAGARRARKMTQAQLAELLDVSAEAVSKWEQDRYAPTPENLNKLDRILGLFRYEEDGTIRNMRLFDEEHMSAYLKGKLDPDRYPGALAALSFAKEKHQGTYRKPREAGVPYINHPLTMACHALAMGLEEDALLSALLLHDVAEDCGVPVSELPASEKVRRIVELVTKPQKPYSLEDYYAGILTDPVACLVKCIDRCSNLSSMPAGFSDAKIREYAAETERFYPKLLKVIKVCPAYNSAAWLLSYQIRSLTAMAGRIG